MTKLTAQQVRTIFTRLKRGEKQKALSYEYRVSIKTISAIKCGNRWQRLHLHGGQNGKRLDKGTKGHLERSH